MSNFVLNSVLQQIASERMKELIEKAKEATPEGKLKLIEEKLFFCLLEGYNLGTQTRE